MIARQCRDEILSCMSAVPHCQGGPYQYMFSSYDPGVRVRACMRCGCVRACVRACVRVHVHRCVRAYTIEMYIT